MHFREALAKVCERPIKPNGAFETYSQLCDLCGDHFESVRKIALFYKVDLTLDVAHRIQSEGRDAVSDVLASYPTVKNVLDENSFKKMINAVAEVILDGKTDVDSKSRLATSPTAQPVKPAPAQKAKKRPSGNGGAPAKAAPSPTPAPAQKAKINRAPQPAKPAAAPRNAFVLAHRSRGLDIGDFVKCAAILIIPVLIGLFVPLTNLPLWAKWVVGVIGAILTAAFVLVGTFAFDEMLSCSIGGQGLPFVLAIPLIISGIRFIRAGSDYAVIAGCVSVVMFLIGLYGIFAHENMGVCGPIAIVESFISLVMFLCAISYPSVSPWLIGITFSLVLAFCIWKAYDEVEFDDGFPAIATLVVLIASIFLLIFLPEYFLNAFRCIAVACALLSGHHIYHAFDDDEIGFGVVSIVNCVLSVAGFVLAFFLL